MLRKVVVACIAFAFTSTVAYASSIEFHEGDVGKDIAEIQVKLKEQGYYKSKVDGKFTHEMEESVRKFQKIKNLKPDGIIGEKTYVALIGRSLLWEKQILSSNSSSSRATKIVDTAMKLIGVPYQWGGVTPKGFDCSGFVWYVFDKNAISLPRTADVQYEVGKAVARENLQKGDLVFFTTYAPGASHTGIYLENGNFIQTSSSKGVMVSNLADYYWKGKYLGARRVL